MKDNKPIRYEIITTHGVPPLHYSHMLIVPSLFESSHFYNDFMEEKRCLKHKQIAPIILHIKKTIEAFFNIHCRKIGIIDKQNTIMNRSTNNVNAFVLVHLGKFGYLDQCRNGVKIEHILNTGTVIFISRSIATRFLHKVRSSTDESVSILLSCSSYQYR